MLISSNKTLVYLIENSRSFYFFLFILRVVGILFTFATFFSDFVDHFH